VTADAVKVGIVMVDYSSIADFIDFKRGDQQKIAQAFVDDINANGGVAGGKKLVPTYYSFVPIGSAGPLASCTKLTEDTKVFATIGVLIDSSGAGQLCYTKQHKSILITHELSENNMKKATPGLLLTPDALAERSTREMLQLANEQGLLKDKKFAIVAETGTKSRIDSAIKPTLEQLGVPVGTSGTLTLGDDPDTTAAQAQLDSLIERWKGEGVNAVFLSGLATVSKVFVQKIKAAFPDAFLMTDGDSSAKAAGQDAQQANVSPNPYAGMVSLTGLTDEQQFETPNVQKCMAVWEKPDKDGKREEIWITVRDMCSDLDFFKVIADKNGQYLNNENWTQTVDNFGAIPLVGSAKGSLHTGKYDADDFHALVSFDPTAGTNGDWKQLTQPGQAPSTTTTTP
jgi:hypothetical protein